MVRNKRYRSSSSDSKESDVYVPKKTSKHVKHQQYHSRSSSDSDTDRSEDPQIKRKPAASSDSESDGYAEIKKHKRHKDKQPQQHTKKSKKSSHSKHRPKHQNRSSSPLHPHIKPDPDGDWQYTERNSRTQSIRDGRQGQSGHHHDPGQGDRRDHVKHEDIAQRIKQEPSSDDERRQQRTDRQQNNQRRRERHRAREQMPEEQNNWGRDSEASGTSQDTKPDKEEPNFELSGKLTEDTNSYKGVVIKYNEPPEARKPKRRWRLYPFKNDEAMKPFHMHRQSAFLFGRDRLIADIPVDHPSCSKQHAIFQYRMVEYDKDGRTARRIAPYIIDLDSANGTFLNNQQIEARRYYEIQEKDVIKFGFSSREYVLLHDTSNTAEVEDSD